LCGASTTLEVIQSQDWYARCTQVPPLTMEVKTYSYMIYYHKVEYNGGDLELELGRGRVISIYPYAPCLWDDPSWYRDLESMFKPTSIYLSCTPSPSCGLAHNPFLNRLKHKPAQVCSCRPTNTGLSYNILYGPPSRLGYLRLCEYTCLLQTCH
jgi:hypothetical protein